MKIYRKLDFWKTIDFKRRSEEIAVEFSITASRVAQLRRKFAPTTIYKYRKNWSTFPQRFKWETVNWFLSNVEIAQNLGCSREAVRKKRILCQKRINT